jgi:hypothetical protein
MVNPDGARPIAFNENDRCILLGRSPSGQVVADARYLYPATRIGLSEIMPPWTEIQEEDGRLLISVASGTPGLPRLAVGRKIGFNLIVVDADGNLLSWAPLTMRFSWDSPSVWGLLKLKK